MGLVLEYQDGQTPLSDEERLGLKILAVSTHGELNALEQRNIEIAIEWILRKDFTPEQVLSEGFIQALHSKMFSDVWKWAGNFRKSDKNIGVEWSNIGIELRQLLDDAKYWLEQTTFTPDEYAIRFSHRLVSIHCFPNGNGRHSRIMADIIIESIFAEEIFSWHRKDMVKAGEIRTMYINSLKEADKGNIRPLLKFARS